MKGVKVSEREGSRTPQQAYGQRLALRFRQRGSRYRLSKQSETQEKAYSSKELRVSGSLSTRHFLALDVAWF